MNYIEEGKGTKLCIYMIDNKITNNIFYKHHNFPMFKHNSFKKNRIFSFSAANEKNVESLPCYTNIRYIKGLDVIN